MKIENECAIFDFMTEIHGDPVWFLAIAEGKMSVFKFIKNGREQFDFIFADPPYALKELETIPELIFQNNLLKEGGLLVLEHGKDNNFEENPHFIERRVYGSVNFSLFR